MRGGTLKSCLYGGGKGSMDNVESGLVKGNTKVDVKGGIVEHSLYGGGELGSVGTFTEFYTVATGAHVAGEPKTCATGTGKAEVLISGGQVGKNEAVMPDPGATIYEDDLGYVFCGSRGEADTLTYHSANLFAVVKETHLKISGSALITASAYGGSENGLVMGKGAGLEYEIALDRAKFNEAANTSDFPLPMGDTFQTGIRFYWNGWDEFSNMPNCSLEEEQGNGWGFLMRVKTFNK